jgi:uncharacterized membrane protein
MPLVYAIFKNVFINEAKNFFSEKEKQVVVEAIKMAESKTSGEIRVHIENFCFGNEIKRAQKVFTNLKMHLTKERNGVLIYIAVGHKKIAIIGDEGIHKQLGTEYWEVLVKNLIKQFRNNKKGEGLAESIIECGLQLGKFFPRRDDDINELSNQISY